VQLTCNHLYFLDTRRGVFTLYKAVCGQNGDFLDLLIDRKRSTNYTGMVSP
jgi:hypothetical protein